MSICVYCQSKEIDYKCPICGHEFCFLHTGSTDVFTCKNHPNMQLNRIQSEVRKGRCQIMERSRCPTCGSDLEYATLPTGQLYLQCIKCSWNSRINSPIILGANDKYIEREAEKYGLARHPTRCNEKFKRQKGQNFCTNCLITELSNQTEIFLSSLQNKYGLSIPELENTIQELLNRNLVKGFLEPSTKVFIYLPANVEAQLVADLQTNGFLDFTELQKQLKTSSATFTRIMIEIIRKNKFRGTFTFSKTRYYIEQGLIETILSELKTQGKITHTDFARKYDIPDGNVKNYIMNMMKSQIILAYFADGGNITISEEELENEIENFSMKNGIFMLNALATHLKIAPELARRILFKLIQKGVVRGIFTQNHEFLTEEKLSEKIKAIARAYRTIAISDLAKKLAITEQRVEEGLATLISKGAINGYIDMAKHQFIADGKQPVTGFSSIPAEQSAAQTGQGNQTPLEAGDVEVVRQYDFVGGQLHFKVVVRNMTKMAIHDVKVLLDVPSSFRRAQELLIINVIDPNNTHGVDFYLEPAECGISTIGGTVIYKDAMGKFHTIYIQPKEVQIKCPLLIKSLDTIEDCQKAIQSLPSDARAFLIADLPAQMAYSAAHRAVAQFDVTNVASFESDQAEADYEAEAWFSSQAKVTGGRIIIRAYINGKNATLEIRVWCNDPGQLTGLLAKMLELLFVEINMMRKIKSEERTRTIDVMAITRNLMEISNICMLRYKASSARLKLQDTYTRLTRISNQCDDSCQRIYDWMKKLEADPYTSDETMLVDQDADVLDADIQGIQHALQTQLGV